MLLDEICALLGELGHLPERAITTAALLRLSSGQSFEFDVVQPAGQPRDRSIAAAAAWPSSVS
jgi:hypothetical protein